MSLEAGPAKEKSKIARTMLRMELKPKRGIVPSARLLSPTTRDTSPEAKMNAAMIFTISSIALVLLRIIRRPNAMNSKALIGPENLLLYPNVIIIVCLNSTDANLRHFIIIRKSPT